MSKNLTTREKQALETKHKLIQSARKIFIRDGFEKTTISQIIKDASIGYGTAYVYFKNKHELFIFIMDEVMQHFFKVAKQEFRPETVEEANAQIKEQVRDYLTLAIEHSAIMKVVKDAIGTSNRVQEEWEDIQHEFIDGITSDITHSQKQQLVSEDFDAALTAKSWYYMNEMFMWELVDVDNIEQLEHIVSQLSLFYSNALYR